MNMKKTMASAIVLSMVVMTFFTGAAAATSLYLSANHHTAQFDAWNIYPNGTVEFQATYALQHSTDPAGIGCDSIPADAPVLFISSEFSAGIEMVNPLTLEYMGVSSGPSNIAGVDVDDEDDIVYTLSRGTNDLHIFSWDPVAKSLTQIAMVDLPGLGMGYGLALDDSRDILWVSDTGNSMVRAYDVDVTSWTDIVEIPSLSRKLSLPVIDVAVDTKRNMVYTVGAYIGSPLLSKYDVASGTETTVDLGVGGVGVAVNELTGYVYITRGLDTSADDLQVWDTSTTPFTLLQDTPRIGNPAGLCIPQGEVAFNPLNLTNEHGLTDCVKPGDFITYTICYDNIRNPDVHNVAIVDDLPAEVRFVSATGGGTYYSATHTVTWDIGTIPAQTSQQCVQLVVQVDHAATPGINITNSATINGDEPGYTGPTTVNAEVCVIYGVTYPPTPVGVTGVPVLTPFGMLALIEIGRAHV